MPYIYPLLGPPELLELINQVGIIVSGILDFVALLTDSEVSKQATTSSAGPSHIRKAACLDLMGVIMEHTSTCIYVGCRTLCHSEMCKRLSHPTNTYKLRTWCTKVRLGLRMCPAGGVAYLYLLASYAYLTLHNRGIGQVNWCPSKMSFDSFVFNQKLSSHLIDSVCLSRCDLWPLSTPSYLPRHCFSSCQLQCGKSFAFLFSLDRGCHSSHYVKVPKPGIRPSSSHFDIWCMSVYIFHRRVTY